MGKTHTEVFPTIMDMKVIYCRCLLNYIQKKQGRSPFLTLEVLPEFDFGHQTLKSDNFIELSISCTLGLRSHSTPFCTTSPWFLPISRDESLVFYGQLVRPKTHQNELV